MRTRIFLALLLLILVCFSVGDTRFVSAENKVKRIRFQIRTIGENSSGREILAATTVEGLPGTDFRIDLKTGNFKMQTRFLSDLMADGVLKMRANLETRRLYGQSAADLPLYEEDAQKKAFEMKFDETIVLLPFGRNGGSETLKIEITPVLVYAEKDRDAERIKIDFDKRMPGGEIYIEASKIPHNFNVEAVLFEDGREIARGNAVCLFEEAKEIALRPLAQSDRRDFKTLLTVSKFERSRPEDLIGIRFDFYKNGRNVLANAAGINQLGGELAYRLDGNDWPKDKVYELKFRVRLAENK